MVQRVIPNHKGYTNENAKSNNSKPNLKGWVRERYLMGVQVKLND